MRENVQHTVCWVEAEDVVKCLTMYRTTPHRKKDAIGNCKIILRLRKTCSGVTASGMAGSRDANNVYKAPFLSNSWLLSSALTSHTNSTFLFCGLAHRLTETSPEKRERFFPINQTESGMELHSPPRNRFDLRECGWRRRERTF